MSILSFNVCCFFFSPYFPCFWGGRDIKRENALCHVFGYTIANDVTARDIQKKHTQWFKGNVQYRTVQYSTDVAVRCSLILVIVNIHKNIVRYVFCNEIPCHVILHNTIWNPITLYCTVLYCTVLYCTVLYCTVQYYRGLELAVMFR